MMNTFRKYRKEIYLITIVVFLIGAFAGFGSYFFSPKGSPNDSIVDVDSDKVPLRLYLNHYDRALQNLKPGTVLDDAGKKQIREETIRDLVQQVVFNREIKRYGIEVPDDQVITSLSQVPAFQDKGHFSPELYVRALNSQLKTTPQDFEEEQRTSIGFFKLRWLIQSSIKVTDKEFEMAQAVDPKAKLTRDQLLQQKTIWCFNQWFSQVGQKIKVKPHLDLLEGIR